MDMLVQSSPPGPGDAGNAATAPRLRIDLANPAFTDAVMSDIHCIRRTRSGRTLFRRLCDTGRMVTIEQPTPPTDPPNAWTLLRSMTEVVVTYDPSDWPSGVWPDCPSSDVILFGRLLDAAILASGDGTSPKPEGVMLASYLTERISVAVRKGTQP